VVTAEGLWKWVGRLCPDHETFSYLKDMK
jgi:hypothetical protein